MVEQMIFNPIPPSHHCVTGSMWRIFDYYQCRISEDMLLGLGEGVGFVYWHAKGTTPFLGGRANVGRPGEEGMENAACRRTGVSVYTSMTASEKKAESQLVESLQHGQPVMLQVDMGFLPYLQQHGEYHFGGHVISAFGLNNAEGKVLVADREKELYWVSLDSLRKARGSKYKPFQPNNRAFTFDFGNFHAPTADEIQLSIQQSAKRMISPPIANLGIKGIHTAAERILKWPTVMSAEELKWAFFNLWIFIDATGGTGGGLFRYMYARFLQEAASITGNGKFAAAGVQMKAAGDLWQQIAEMGKAASANVNNEAISEIKSKLNQIATAEEKIWQALL